ALAPPDVEAHRQALGDQPYQGLAEAAGQLRGESDRRMAQRLQGLEPVAPAEGLELVGIAQRTPGGAKGEIVGPARDEAKRRPRPVLAGAARRAGRIAVDGKAGSARGSIGPRRHAHSWFRGLRRWWRGSTRFVGRWLV